jgi:hypothetical protein
VVLADDAAYSFCFVQFFKGSFAFELALSVSNKAGSFSIQTVDKVE